MKVIVSSSCKYEKEWPGLSKLLNVDGVDVYLPVVKDLTGLSQEDVDRVMETVNREYFEEINNSDILYVYCPGGYIGRGVASEIDYAIAKGKKVIASNNIDDLGIWSLINKVMNPKEFKKYISEVAYV
jgi:nucleoside 2-deoxyribosyltransferase